MLLQYPTAAIIDLAAIRANYQAVRACLPPGQQILGVVKSNAYGHGAAPVARVLEEAACPFLGVRSVEEAITLREAGIKLPLLIMLGLIDENFREIIAFNLTPVITRLEVAKPFHDYLQKNQTSCPVHIKVDTGMSRLGVALEKVTDFFRGLGSLPTLQIEGVMSHLAEACDPEYTAFQKKNFDAIRTQLMQQGLKVKHWHLGNSAAAIRALFPDTNLVRVGIALYGSYPDPSLIGAIKLQPALSWITRVLETKSIPKGRAVSYGCTYHTPRPMRLALLPVGYADGYPRLFSNRGAVLIKGQRAPIVGRVCMDLTVVDITDIPEVPNGEKVTLLGRDGTEELLASELATWAETISYEILTRIAGRVPRCNINQ